MNENLLAKAAEVARKERSRYRDNETADVIEALAGLVRRYQGVVERVQPALDHEHDRHCASSATCPGLALDDALHVALIEKRPDRCPRCDSPHPERHPAMQFEGEVQPCPDPWHEQVKV